MDLSNPEFFNSREISWLEFNERVLEEAMDKTLPLLERLKFLAITASNLDEFYMVRVSTLVDQEIAEFNRQDAAGLTPGEQLSLISKKVHEFSTRQYNCLNRSILPSLEKEGVYFYDYEDIKNTTQKDFIKRYFEQTIYPIVTPMAIDQSHPFPLLNNKSLNFIVELKDAKEKKDGVFFAVLQVPTVISRLLQLPKIDDKTTEFIYIESIIKEYMDRFFTGYTVLHSSVFRITRNSDFEIDEEDTDDLLYEIEKRIKRRKWGEPVRLEINKDMTQTSKEFLIESLELDSEDIYEILGPLDLTVWFSACSLKGYEHLTNAPLIPQPSADFINKNVFDAIKEKDILVHHPYESFDCVLDFVNAAASDPEVLAIKQTLYRVSGNSPIVDSLIQAAENGKQVTVMVELKARFDEENNISWAKKLEKSGCHVVYGLVGLKTHCKICLVVRREESGICRYVHLGTGNYNDSTAKIYTDIGFFTCKERFGQDISALFNVLTGYSTNMSWQKIAVAPINLRYTFMKYIEMETQNAISGKEALIIAKLNSLVDTEIIQSLYRASMAGVKIKLIIRGICCIKPGIEGLSDNITVVSIVDRFLEHSRIYYFENLGNPKIFLSSADLMPRNLDRRVEVSFPIEDNDLKEKIIEILDITLSDTVKLRVLKPDGSYERIDRRGKEHLHSQLKFHQIAQERYNASKIISEEFIFKPIIKDE